MHFEDHFEIDVAVLHELHLDLVEVLDPFIHVVLLPSEVLSEEEEHDLIHDFLLLVALILVLRLDSFGEDETPVLPYPVVFHLLVQKVDENLQHSHLVLICG